MRTLFLICFTTLLVSCTDRGRDYMIYTQIIKNESSLGVEILTHIHNNQIDTLDILLQGESFTHTGESHLFHSKNQVSFIFSDGKTLHYYFDSVEIQTINNPFYPYTYVDTNSTGFDCIGDDISNECTYTITDEDYDRAGH